MKKLLNNWYLIIIGGFLLAAAIVFFGLGEDSVIAIHDNLDLFMPQYQMMKDTGTFFATDANVPFLGNISRDYLPSEYSLYTLLYMLLPSYYAYTIGYFLKIVVAILGGYLLAKDILGDKTEDYKGVILLVGFAYGILNLFPNFTMCFASIPIVIYLLRRIVNRESHAFFLYLLLFLYPLISYFSYFGIFILGYLCLWFLYRCVRYRRFDVRVFLAIVVLASGYVLFEYRLFRQMLFSDTDSIRGSMVIESLDAKGILTTILTGIVKGDMHSQALQERFILPLCLLFAVLQFMLYIKRGEAKKVFRDPFYGILLFIVFNGIIYGLYSCEAVRNLVNFLLPPLSGFQFSRTIFFNPFLWYVELFIIAMRLFDRKRAWAQAAAYGIVLISIFVTVFSGTRYNDFYHTCLSQYHQLRSGEKNNELSFREFYSEDLFAKALEDIGYCEEWSVAYGFYPAVLQYNGIHTLDGYLGYYEQGYKDQFRKMIAPALERVPESAAYFDNWGARCNLYSGTYAANTCNSRDYGITEEELFLDTDSFKFFCGRYIFAAMELTNADELGFELAGRYTDAASPYTLYVYRTKSWYATKEHSDVCFEQREVPVYDMNQVQEYLGRLEELAGIGVQIQEENQELSQEELLYRLPDGDEILTIYQRLTDILETQSTAATLYNIRYYQDVTKEEFSKRKLQVDEDRMDTLDGLFQQLRNLAGTPYVLTLKEKFSEQDIESFLEYDDMTDEQKNRRLRINSLSDEYISAMEETYYFDYQGETWTQAKLDQAADTLEEEAYMDIVTGLYQQKRAVVGDIFMQLVSLRNEQALEEEYDNYAEYAYDVEYHRDYSVEDAKKLLKKLRKRGGLYFAKAKELQENMTIGEEENASDMQSKQQSESLTGNYTDRQLLESRDVDNFRMLAPYMRQMDDDAGNAADAIALLHLCDMEQREGKGEVGFTVRLYDFGDAFIFDKPYQAVNDLFTYVHEFGHFLNLYHNNEELLYAYDNIDLCEIHSQGMEALFSEYYRDIYGEELGKKLEIREVSDILYNMEYEAILSEFEIYVYEHPEQTIDDYSRKYVEIFEDYGYRVNMLNDEGGCDLWIDTTHLFETPCYYISYLTSSLSSLELYGLSKENRKEAVTKYMEISSMYSGFSYTDAMEYVGLSNVFENNNAMRIIKKSYKSLLELTN